MKKIISVFCTVSLMCTMIIAGGCGEKAPAGNEGTTTSTEAPAATVYSASDLYSTVWAAYGEDEKYPMAGGDFGVANMEAPDKYDIDANKDAFISTFLVPEATLADIEGDVITAMHMMNTNTFCSAMFAVKDSSKTAAFAEEYKKAVQTNMWMCGMPDTVVVLSCNNVVIIAYGADDLIQTFKDKCTSANGDMKILVEAPAMEG